MELVSAFHLPDGECSLSQTTPYLAKAEDLACFRVCGPICIAHEARWGWLPRGHFKLWAGFPQGQKIVQGS